MSYKTIEFTSFVELWAQLLADQDRYLFPRIVLRLTHFPDNYLFEVTVHTGERDSPKSRSPWYLIGRYFLPVELFNKELERRRCKSWEEKKAYISKLFLSRSLGYTVDMFGISLPDITSEGVRCIL